MTIFSYPPGMFLQMAVLLLFLVLRADVGEVSLVHHDFCSDVGCRSNILPVWEDVDR